MKKIAKIMDREGSFQTFVNASQAYPFVRFCSKSHEDIKYISNLTQISTQTVRSGSTALTLHHNSLRKLLPEVIPLMKDKYRKEMVKVLLICCSLCDNKGTTLQERKEAFLEYRRMLNYLKQSKVMNE